MTKISDSTAPAPPKPRQSKGSTSAGEARRWLMTVGLQAAVLLGVFVCGIALLGVSQRVGWIRAGGDSTGSSIAEVKGTIVYTCPMHPDIRQDEPGKCPRCGMPLVVASAAASPQEAPESGTEKRYICPMMCVGPQSEPGKCPVCAMDLVEAASGGSQAGNAVAINGVARRILGIQTAVARKEVVYRAIRVVGQIAYDEQRVATISAYVDGRLEKMLADYVGVSVEEGDDLAVLYSPQLYSAQVEFLTSLESPALSALAGDDDRLAVVARDNLKELGMSPAQIEKLEKSRVAKKRLRINSPIVGTVIAKHKVEGDYVKTGETIYRVVDLSMVWLMLDLFPKDAATVRFGQQVETEVQSLPGVVYTGRVAFVDPIVNATTRTVAVRVEMSNYDGKLKPGDYATAFIRVPVAQSEQVYDPALAGKWISPRHPQIIRDAPGTCPLCGVQLVPTSDLGYADKPPLQTDEVVTVPRDAVLMAGDRSVVYVESKSGLFEIRRVTLGPLTDNEAVILDGLDAGETVATQGNFLIDSQMQLTGGASLRDPGRVDPSRMDPSRVEPSRMDPGRMDPSRVEPGRLDPSRVEPSRVDPGRVEPSRVDPGRVEPGRVEPGGSDSSPPFLRGGQGG